MPLNWSGLMARLGIASNDSITELMHNMDDFYEQLYIDGKITKKEAVAKAPALAARFAAQELQQTA